MKIGDKINIEFEIIREVVDGELIPGKVCVDEHGNDTPIWNLRRDKWIGRPSHCNGPLMVFCDDGR